MIYQEVACPNTRFLIYLDIHRSDLKGSIQPLGTAPAIHVRTVPGVPVVDLHFLDSATDLMWVKLGDPKKWGS